MKNLNEMGVMELKQAELQKVEGGCWGLVLGGLIGAFLSDVDAFGNGFAEGYANYK